MAARKRKSAASHSPGDEVSNFLASVLAFSTLRPEVIRLLAAEMRQQAYSAGQALMHQGQPGDSLIVLTSGHVVVQSEDAQGVCRDIAQVGRGHVLGEMALLTEESRTATVTARDDVSALLLPAEAFHRLATAHPEISVVLTRLVAQRLGGAAWDVLAGKCFGPWQVGRRLGRGGMSVVYEGQHMDTGERAALKMLSHRLVYDPNSLAQFQQEADIISSFRHTNITSMLGRFEAFRTYFIAIEFCDGITLEQTLAVGGPLAEAEVRKVVGQLVAALHYAHAAGVVHRDIKPSNVMINRDGVVKLMDFGLAKPILEHHPDVPGPITGTPRYMSPEQLAGTRVDQRSDYFGLGLVTYEMLTGEPLFSALDFGALLSAHARWQMPDFPSQLPGVSPELCGVLEGCLAPDPTARLLETEKLVAWNAPLDPAVIPWERIAAQASAEETLGAPQTQRTKS